MFFSIYIAVLAVSAYLLFGKFKRKCYGLCKLFFDVSFRKVAGIDFEPMVTNRNFFPDNIVQDFVERKELLEEHALDGVHNDFNELLHNVENVTHKIRETVTNINGIDYQCALFEKVVKPYKAYLHRLFDGANYSSVFYFMAPPIVQAFLEALKTQVVRLFRVPQITVTEVMLHVPTLSLAGLSLAPVLETCYRNFRLNLPYRYAPAERSYWFARSMMDRILNHLQSKIDYQVSPETIVFYYSYIIKNFLYTTNRCQPIIDPIYCIDSTDYRHYIHDKLSSYINIFYKIVERCYKFQFDLISLNVHEFLIKLYLSGLDFSLLIGNSGGVSTSTPIVLN